MLRPTKKEQLDGTIWIPVANVQKVCDPLATVPWVHWGFKKPIKHTEVAKAAKKKIVDEPFCGQEGRQYHVNRIAYLAKHGWDDAISVDVGVPSLGCHVDWPVCDGNHRLAAAIYRGDKEILVEVGGDIEYFAELFCLSEQDVFAVCKKAEYP